MHKRFERVASVLVIIITLGVAGVCLYAKREQLVILANLSWDNVMAIVISLLAFFVCTSYTFYLIVGMVTVRMEVVEWVGLTFLTNFFNYLGPVRPGAAVKAVYLKRQKGLAYTRFASVLAANGFLLLLVSGLTGLLLLFIVWLQEAIFSFTLTLLCLALVSGSLLPFLVSLSQINHVGRVWNLINSAIEGFDRIRNQRWRLIGVAMSVTVQYLLSAILMLVTYRALGIELDFFAALFIGVFTSISNFFSVTPNNLGLQEVAIGYLSTVFGVDFATGVISGGVIRAVHMLLTFSLAPLFGQLLLKPIGVKLITFGLRPINSNECGEANDDA